jgi:hypothetical protein
MEQTGFDAYRKTGASGGSPWRSCDPRISSQSKTAARAGQNAGPPAGPDIPVLSPQVIECAQDFATKKFSNAIPLADPSNRLRDSPRSHLSPEAKKGRKTSRTTGSITGAESPVIFHQAIEYIVYFGEKIFSRTHPPPVAGRQWRMGSA